MEPGRPTFLIGSIGKYGVVKVQGATSLKGTSATWLPIRGHPGADAH